MDTLLILDDDAQLYKSLVEQRAFNRLTVVAATDAEQALPVIGAATIILGRPDLVSAVLDRADRLRWVQSTFAGVDALLMPGLRQDYLLTGVKDVFGPLMSEYVLAYILARERNVIATFQQQSRHHWQPLPYRSLDRLTVGIVGLGSIGRHLAGTLRSFGCRVLGMKRQPGIVDNVEQVFTPEQRADFLPLLDYLLLILPATPQTRHFIGAAELALMKPESVVINVGRGSTIAQDDLIAALQSGRIGGAILDVFAQEPLPADNPLWDMPQVLITPHSAAYSFPEQIVDLFCTHYLQYSSGRPLDHLIDFSQGY